jgi:hypothetical protein
MFKTIFAAAALLTTVAPAVAFAAEEAPNKTFTYQGVTYTYTTELKNGVKVLKGSANNGKVPFELRVSKAGVTGSFNHTPVEFDLHEVEHIDAKGQ